MNLREARVEAEQYLASCPFCGGSDIASVPCESFPEYESNYDVVAQCLSCGARGPDNNAKIWGCSIPALEPPHPGWGGCASCRDCP